MSMGLLRVLVQNKTLSSEQAGRYQQALKDNKDIIDRDRKSVV